MTVEVEVINGRRRLGSWAVAVEDCVKRRNASPADNPLRPRLMFPYVAADSGCGSLTRVLPQAAVTRWGRCEFPRDFHWGCAAQRVAGQRRRVAGPAAAGRLRQAWLRHCRRRRRFARRAAPGVRAGDFFAVREWQAGDSVRWVHWRSTARHRELVVRQFEQPGERQLAVLLDLWEPKEPQADHSQRVELAVSFAATLVADLCRRRGLALLAIAAAQPVCLAGRAAGGFAHEALVSLALAQASPAASAVCAAGRSAQTDRSPRRVSRDQHAPERRGEMADLRMLPD